MKFALWLTVLFVGTAQAQAQNSEGTSAIRSLEQQWTTGQARNDSAALNLIFDDALVYVEYGKLVSKSEYLVRIKHAQPESDQIEVDTTSVQIFGQTAIVVGVYAEKQMKGNRRQFQRWRFIDTWVYKKNGWVLVATGASPIKD
jgi:hypothetical protein